MDNEKLKEILERHRKWLNDEDGGERANLYEANLYGANLREANLCEAKNIPFIPLVCPERGSFTAFKKCGSYIIELLIPQDAKRCSATTRKCRASYAKVVAITNMDGSQAEVDHVTNHAYEPIEYKIGEYVHPDSFDDDRWNECSHGIHFSSTAKKRWSIKEKTNDKTRKGRNCAGGHRLSVGAVWLLPCGG